VTNYLDEIAHEIIACCAETGHGCDLPTARLYALLVLTKGEDTRLEDVHNAWAVDAANTDSGHLSIVPFDALTRARQLLDFPYVKAIWDVAARRKERAR
jgi:hypothetical protein